GGGGGSGGGDGERGPVAAKPSVLRHPARYPHQCRSGISVGFSARATATPRTRPRQRLFCDDRLERLRSFPDIGRDELIRFFTLTSPCSVRCQLALVGSEPYRRSRTVATTLATRASKASSSSASAALAPKARRSHRTPARQIRSMARVAVMSVSGSPDTSMRAARWRGAVCPRSVRLNPRAGAAVAAFSG